MAAFDPYHEWLGIPPQDQPPDHYRMLGIAPLEPDPRVIAGAAKRQMARLKACPTGGDAESQRQAEQKVRELLKGEFDTAGTPAKSATQSRAKHWYEKALPRLAGLDRIKAESRLQAAAIEAIQSSSGAGVGVVEVGNVALASNGTTVTSIGKPIHSPAELLDGDMEILRNSKFAYSEWPCEWVITLDKVYQLQEIRFLLWDGDERYYRHIIATSIDGRSYVPLVDRSQGEWRSWQRIQLPARPVKAIKLLGLYNSAARHFFVVEFEAYCLPPSTRQR